MGDRGWVHKVKKVDDSRRSRDIPVPMIATRLPSK
jgi:hypothetical protein